jgi:hypothetical protein
MFSNEYRYYAIHGNNFSEKIQYKNIVGIIIKQNCFIQTGNQTFKNNNNFPWIDMSIFYTQNGNYSVNNKKLIEVNLITIITSKEIDQKIYIIKNSQRN